MAIEPISVIDSRWKRKKKATKHTSKRRKLKSALKTIFNYMKSDSYLFAPLIHRQIRYSSPLSYVGEVSIKPRKEKEKKKLGEDLNEYLKCDAYMYAPLAMDGTPNPSSESARVCNPVGRVVVEQSETVEHILHRRPLSSKGDVLTRV